MTKQEFATLAENKVLLLDGATGSNLILAGMPRGVPTETWVIEHPEVFIKLQRSYVEAGSDIVYAPTFAANSVSLKNFELQDQVRKLNSKLVSISKEAVEGKALVAGDITTSGQLMVPRGDMTYDRLFEVYKEQIEALAEAGVDLLVAETMLGVEETMVALDAASAVCELPMMCTLTLEADGTALYGGNAVEAVETLQEMGAAAVGLNCSVGPDQLESVIRNMKKVAHVPIIAKPNAGMPVINEKGEAIYNMDAATFGRHMKVLVEAGAGIIGGCCGTDAEYIRELRRVIN